MWPPLVQQSTKSKSTGEKKQRGRLVAFRPHDIESTVWRIIKQKVPNAINAGDGPESSDHLLREYSLKSGFSAINIGAAVPVADDIQNMNKIGSLYDWGQLKFYIIHF